MLIPNLILSLLINLFSYMFCYTNSYADNRISVAHLTNVSARAYISNNTEHMVMGFAITGKDTLKLVIRAIGQGLKNYGINSQLDPKIILLTYPQANFLLSNDDYGKGDPLIVGELTTKKLTPPNYNDSALIASLSGNVYTAEINKIYTTLDGIGLTEIFESPDITGNSRLINLSARSFIGEGLNNQIAGFGITGTGTLKLVIRAIGQGLLNYGILTSLDPRIKVYTYPDRQLIAENDDWEFSNAANELRAKGFNPKYPSDSALILDLTEGYYTIETSPTNKSGIGLVEIFEFDTNTIPSNPITGDPSSSSGSSSGGYSSGGGSSSSSGSSSGGYSSGGGSSSSSGNTCCMYCTIGKPCGNACIESNKTCHIGRGCAC